MTASGHHSDSRARGILSPSRSAARSVGEAITAESTPVVTAVLSGAARVAAALTEGGGPADRDSWLAVVGTCQVLINTVTAVQDTALAQAARRESTWCEDGTLGETVHAPGRITLDAADLAAPLLGASHAQAERRLELAVRLAADKVPVPAEQRELPETSGLRGLHAAMAQGRLDGYRAGVVAFELDLAPADVADAVIAALDPQPGDDSTRLRQRTRRLIARISPDLLRQRAERARASTGLRRWVAEPGVDTWLGTFPSEDAAIAWAAIDQLAHDLVANGTCTNVEQARGKALTDLVTGHANVDVQVVLTVPADSAADSTAPADANQRGEGASRVTERPQHQHDKSVALDPAATADEVRPNISAADGIAPPGAPVVRGPASPRRDSDGDDDLVQVHGARPSEPLLVRRGWLRDHLAKQQPAPRRGRVTLRPVFVPCDPLTGARLDPAGDLSTDAYRPSAELTALVKARDGRCRFPGCSVAARFCDLDHVRPWPLGPTAAHNLLTLCRRHHRIKQRPGWRLRLATDGSATWTDPSGRTRTTMPVDALDPLVLVPERTEHLETVPAADTCTATGTYTGSAGTGANTGSTGTAAGSSRRDGSPDPGTSTWSLLETILELRVEHARAADLGHGHHPAHRRCTTATTATASVVRAGFARLRAHRTFSDLPPF